MKIGIFGSSFNPIHIAHLIVSEQALVRLKLDKVVFVPTANPYHKKVDLLDFDIRYEMAKNAISDNENFEISEVERDLKKSSYSYDVLKLLEKDYKGEFYFIIGSDSFNNLDTWYKYEEFINMTNLVVFKRPKYAIDLEKLAHFRNISKKEIIYYDDLQFEISSSDIRKSIKEGYIPKYILDEKTEDFIKENFLWQ